MTREERELSIDYLEGIKDNYIEGHGYERHPLPEYYAIENAIKALEQQPCEDCISREDILNHQYTIDESEALGISTRNVVNVDDILNAKPVQPKSKTGHWITVTNGRGGHECSLCHGYAPSYKDGDEWLTKYCPNCGAKMINVPDKNVGK